MITPRACSMIAVTLMFSMLLTSHIACANLGALPMVTIGRKALGVDDQTAKKTTGKKASQLHAQAQSYGSYSPTNPYYPPVYEDPGHKGGPVIPSTPSYP